jgi:hypothetical protein
LAGPSRKLSDTDNQNQLFRSDVRLNHTTPMCYIEDIYHSQCGHWSSKPQIYHHCSRGDKNLTTNENNAIIGRTCYNRKTCGSREEDSRCKQCKLADREKLQRGTCMSVFTEGDRIKVLRTPEFAQRIELGKQRSSRILETRTTRIPSGFFSWGVSRTPPNP